MTTRVNAVATAGLFAMLTACGSSEPAPVVEQIVVAEPGKASSGVPSSDGGSADRVAAGRNAFQACTGCHVAEKDAASTAGPNLFGVVGRKAGSVEDFAYSEALASSDITWDYAELDRFLANPAGYVPGTSMVAGAVRDGERRAAIVAYLASTSE